jgi:DNA-directed RNA polymerase subunit RPC12/RpoP
MSENFPPPGFIPTESAIPGIEVFIPAPPDSGPHQEIVDFKCPQCGATTAFSAADGGLTCTHCSYYEAPKKPIVGRAAEQFEFTVETMARAAQGWGTARKELSCQNCGATTSLPEDSLTVVCPFCGSNKVIQRQAAQDLLRPRFVLPFKITEADCARIARQWLGESWMLPSGLSDIATLGGFTGLYLPYWTFDADLQADWKAEVGHTKTERYYNNGEWKTRTVVEWRWESGRANLHIDDLLTPGSARLSQNLLHQIGNFDLSTLAPYEPAYLAGFQAKAYDIPLEAAWEVGRQAMREQARLACLSQTSTPQVRNFNMNLDYANESWRYVLLPVYVAHYTYAGKTYQALVNGQSGAIAGQRPVDWNKVWLAIAAILSPGVLLGLLGLMTAPLAGIGMVIGGVGFTLLIIGVVIAIAVYVKADRMDDL